MFNNRNTGKSRTEKQNRKASDNHDADVEQPNVVKEEVMSEVNETEVKVNDASSPDEQPEIDECADAGVANPDDEMQSLRKQMADMQDKYLRLAAEFDNYRKRTVREKMEIIQTAGESLLKDILPLVDDFERGMESASTAEDMDAVRTGFGLIYNKLKDFLNSHGVREIIAINEPFDADRHEAITKIPAPSDDMKGKVVDVIQKGYTLNDKVMRYPKVVVGEQ